MNDKERLQEIKGYVELNTIKNADGDEIEFYAVKAADFDWLIEQAEKAVISEELLDQQRAINMKIKLKYTKQKQQLQQTQQENERLKKFLSWEQEEAQGLDEEVTFQLERLKQAQAKIEQYERARQSYLQACDELEAYANEPDIVLSIVSELRAALEGES